MATLLDKNYSIITYRYNGGPKVFEAGFALGILTVEHVQIYVLGDVDGAGEQRYLNFTWDYNTNTATVTSPINIPPGQNNVTVVVARTVPKEELYMSFAQGADITKTNIDKILRYAIMAVHEVHDGRLKFAAIEELVQIAMGLIAQASIDAARAENAAAQAEAARAAAQLQAALAEAAATRAENAAALLDPKPLVVLAMGQSNMRSVSAMTGGDLSPRSNVFAWNSQAAPMANGTAWVEAQIGSNPFIGASDANNLAFQACKELQLRTGRPVYLFLVALGGHSIEAFMNAVDLSNNGWTKPAGDADLFTFYIDQLNAGLPLIPGSPSNVDVILWHQGEANKEDQAEVYAHKLRVLLKRLEFNGRAVRNETDIVAGELLVGANNGRFRERHLSALRRLQEGTREDAFPRFKIARSTGLQPVTLNDDLHFHGTDITALGKRYVDALFSAVDLPELDPTTCDLSVDGGLAWATGLVAGQNQNTYSRREPYYLAATPLTIEDNADIGWCYVNPQATTTHLVSRKMMPILGQRQLIIDLEVRNPHPSAVGTVRVGAMLYDNALVHTGNAFNDINIPADTTERVTVSVGYHGTASDVGISLLARRIAPLITLSPSGTGPALRFNILGMQWG